MAYCRLLQEVKRKSGVECLEMRCFDLQSGSWNCKMQMVFYQETPDSNRSTAQTNEEG